MREPEFLTRAIVEQLHTDSLTLFGGSAGIRDEGLVDSALASARNTYLYGYGDLFEIAASYAFHIAEAQAFLDGNKRTAVAAALTFLQGNDVKMEIDDQVLFMAMIDVANKKMTKADLAGLFRKCAQPEH
ncbi:MAG TPA: type II toxin-antitoxin system death-on-curing family toxin [Candidatus Paceibacterota bacterium]|nr:type II toxin-antitoxin system death-on-curing family toxin [Candidatus Paceibacterota bacterium]